MIDTNPWAWTPSNQLRSSPKWLSRSFPIGKSLIANVCLPSVSAVHCYCRRNFILTFFFTLSFSYRHRHTQTHTRMRTHTYDSSSMINPEQNEAREKLEDKVIWRRIIPFFFFFIWSSMNERDCLKYFFLSLLMQNIWRLLLSFMIFIFFFKLTLTNISYLNKFFHKSDRYKIKVIQIDLQH